MASEQEVEAGVAWFNANFNGQPDSEALVRGILQAAAAIPPSGEAVIERTITGESVNGVPVIGWMYEEPNEFVGSIRHCDFHWSTPPKNVEIIRLVDARHLAPPAPVAIDEAMAERLRTQLLRHREVEVDAAGLRAALTDAAALNPQPNGGRDGKA